jgi:hypothetical protein
MIRMRRKMILAVFAALGAAAICAAQNATAPARGSASGDQLGMTCAQIVAMSSTDWVAKYSAVKGTDSATTIRGIGAYGKCYDARTDQLSAALGRSGKGPLMGARGNFLSLQKALDDFKAKALADSQPPADPVKTAYATLYEKQFRYEFYQSYAPKPVAPATTTTGRGNAAPTSAAASAGANGKAPGATASGDSTASDTTKPATRPDPNANNNDPVTLAKNHFGALLGDLPDDQMHALHSSFGEILGANAATSHMQLLIYRYAIFLLEPPGEKPFAAPPF